MFSSARRFYGLVCNLLLFHKALCFNIILQNVMFLTCNQFFVVSVFEFDVGALFFFLYVIIGGIISHKFRNWLQIWN
jgi:hypothetical protein